VFIERLKRLEEQEKVLKEELETICREEEKEKFIRTPDVSIAFLLDVLEKFPSATPSEKNELLKGIIKRIEYRKTEKMCKNKMHSDLSLNVIFL